jgi:hypothetical protein
VKKVVNNAAAVVEFVALYAAGSKPEAVHSAAPGNGENFDHGAAAELVDVVGYHLA